MARYRGAKLRITRRLGDLPGLTSKTSKLSKRPGQHGATPKKINTICNSIRRKTKASF
jgi:small subunit ribosomal protein S4